MHSSHAFGSLLEASIFSLLPPICLSVSGLSLYMIKGHVQAVWLPACLAQAGGLQNSLAAQACTVGEG